MEQKIAILRTLSWPFHTDLCLQVTFPPSPNLRYESIQKRWPRSSVSPSLCFATQTIMDTPRFALQIHFVFSFVRTTSPPPNLTNPVQSNPIWAVPSRRQARLHLACVSRRRPSSLGTHCHHYITGETSFLLSFFVLWVQLFFLPSFCEPFSRALLISIDSSSFEARVAFSLAAASGFPHRSMWPRKSRKIKEET